MIRGGKVDTNDIKHREALKSHTEAHFKLNKEDNMTRTQNIIVILITLIIFMLILFGIDLVNRRQEGDYISMPVMTPLERAERACVDSKYFKSCVNQTLDNLEE